MKKIYEIHPGGESLLEALRDAGAVIDAPCGGRGVCGKCAVTVTGRALVDGSPRDLCGESVPACRVRASGILSVELVFPGEMEVLADGAGVLPADGEQGLGAAVDIGTTTIAVYLYNMEDGTLLGTRSGANVQRAYGADVISRISYCGGAPGGLEELSAAIRGQVKSYVLELLSGHGGGIAELRRVSVAGNTVMQHIYAGLSPVGIGVAPFTPLSLFSDSRPGGDYGFGDMTKVYITPAIAGYVGGDITAGLFASGVHLAEKPELFIDVGTNGEMALGTKRGLICCATAAGPSFEGAEISSGMSGVVGAVSAVRRMGGAVETEVIGGGEATGICGSGLIDALAVMLEIGAVDETGRLLPMDEAPRAALPYIEECEDGVSFRLCEKVCITAGDVRKLQLAKAAIRAGVEVLLSEAGLEVGDLGGLLIAGGFGSFINRESACRIGMLPPESLELSRAVGNAAGRGAAHALLSRGVREELEEIRGMCRYIELSSHSGFSDAFMEAMMFT